MKYYKIISLQNTKKIELERYGKFNEEYHQKYLGKTGYMIGHFISDDNMFCDFRCIITDTDKQGRPLDGDWFHKDDLEEVNEIDIEIKLKI